MKSQPNQPDGGSNDNSTPGALDNLYSLLNELVEDDLSQEQTALPKDLIPVESLGVEVDAIAQLEETKPNKPQKQIEAEIIAPDSLNESNTDVIKSTGNSDSEVSSLQDRSLEDKIVSSSIDFKNTPNINVAPQWIVEKEKQINELASSINNLIPLIVQLSHAQDRNSEEYILKAIVPVIDRVIQQRSAEDRQKMANAIANILPDAIKQEIDNVPESIGKAIAPEIALSIKEQTELDSGAIAEALGSEMGKAIKTQIEVERDAMVDALYPVIGSTIAKYMAEVVESINEKVDNALSPKGIRRKFRAKMQGVTEAELIFKESFPYSIRAVFLIHNASGLVIREFQPDTQPPLESELLAGMLTAIRSFASDCIAANSNLDEINYDAFQILFETAGYCYLAVVVNGEPDRHFRDRMRETFAQIVTEYGDAIENYQGDPATVPESIQPLLEELSRETVSSNTKSSKTLYWLLASLLGIILIPWGWVLYRGYVANGIEQKVAVELDATPELSVYRLSPEVKQGKLTLAGRVPSVYLRDKAAKVSNPIAMGENLVLDNQIVAVNVPADPTVTSQEVARMTDALNRGSKAIIRTDYQAPTVTINGLILDPTERKELITTFKTIPGVENAIFVIEQPLPSLDARIYFPSDSSQFSLAENYAELEEIKQFLNQYPLIKLKIIGHSDRMGTKESNLKLGYARADRVWRALIDRGIQPSRLTRVASVETPPDLSPEQPLWLSRCVRFESFIVETR